MYVVLSGEESGRHLYYPAGREQEGFLGSGRLHHRRTGSALRGQLQPDLPNRVLGTLSRSHTHTHRSSTSFPRVRLLNHGTRWTLLLLLRLYSRFYTHNLMSCVNNCLKCVTGNHLQ